jgi:hypothetical protein
MSGKKIGGETFQKEMDRLEKRDKLITISQWAEESQKVLAKIENQLEDKHFEDLSTYLRFIVDDVAELIKENDNEGT